MGNQESIPVNPNGQLKKKKNPSSETQVRSNTKKKISQKKSTSRSTTHFSNIPQHYQENTSYNQQLSPNSTN